MIIVQLVDRDELQVFEEAPPEVLVREERRVQHVEVGEDDGGGVADFAPGVLRGVPVVRGDSDVGQGGVRTEQTLERGFLVLRERFGGVDKQCG